MLFFRLNTHTELYTKLKAVVEDSDCLPMNDMDKYVGQLFLFDFEQSGIHLPEAQRRQVVDLNEYILQLGQRFSTNSYQSRQVNKQDLPPHIRHQLVLNIVLLLLS